VVDVAENEQGERAFLLAQSFMPAQEIHLLRAPHAQLGAWYPARPRGPLHTPDWRFQYEDLMRFPGPPSCASSESRTSDSASRPSSRRSAQLDSAVDTGDSDARPVQEGP
jgi:hypothetical protein